MTLVAPSLYFLWALACGVVLEIVFVQLRAGRRRGFLSFVFVTLNRLGIAYFLPAMVIALTPTEMHGKCPHLHELLLVLSNLALVAMGPLYRHMIPLMQVGGSPDRRWLVRVYASAIPAAALALSVPWLPSERWLAVTLVVHGYVLAMLVRGGGDARRLAARGLLPGAGQVDTAIGGRITLVGWVAMVAGIAGAVLDPTTAASIWLPLLRSGVWLSAIATFVVRIIEQVVRRVVVALVLVAAVAVFFAWHAFAARFSEPETRQVLELAAVWCIVLVLAPGQSWLRALVDRIVLRRRRRRQDELLTSLHALSPELGVGECCRQALAQVAGVMQLRAAAILLPDDTIAHGDFPVAPLTRLWPRGAAAETLPAGAFAGRDVGDPELAHALMNHGVVLVVPIASRRRSWGHLLTVPGRILGTLHSEDDVQTLEVFADQLALVLDSAELLARAVGVERSLAHAEKLAAIGETAARIAHEIRNPVTAARSLAQQLARDSAAPFRAEHELILAELERVERQVAALLRFSRREEYRFEPVDLGELVRTTVDGFRSRLDDGHVAVALHAPEGVRARADREKLRQVLVNLIENALDALGEVPGDRQIDLAVTATNGTATVRVTDTGPGVPAEALPRLFEPFFSGKAQGTGLGLAIAKRTVEAHGGRIDATTGPGRGMTFGVTLPVVAPPAARSG
jgi:signal transduction histidine kinase